MPTLSVRDNFMRLLNGEIPEYIPIYSMMWASGGVPALWGTRDPDGTMRSIWGVESVQDSGGINPPMPKTHDFILTDITKWRDVIKAPDLSDVDWEIACKKDLEAAGDLTEHVISLFSGGGFFLPLMNFMGFTNGLIAMYEEPDEVHALFTYLADYYCSILDQQFKYWGDIIDTMGISDDAATASNPFISPELYRELVKPYHARLAKYGVDRGLAINMHCCGRCEDFIEDWVEIGVTLWNPAQVDNNLDAIKAKYGNSLVLVGCWDSSGPVGWPDAPEEFVKEEVRKTINRYGKGGGFMFYGSAYGTPGEDAGENKKRWMTEAYEAYRAEPYK